jgi:hypothetical protein
MREEENQEWELLDQDKESCAALGMEETAQEIQPKHFSRERSRHWQRVPFSPA